MISRLIVLIIVRLIDYQNNSLLQPYLHVEHLKLHWVLQFYLYQIKFSIISEFHFNGSIKFDQKHLQLIYVLYIYIYSEILHIDIFHLNKFCEIIFMVNTHLKSDFDYHHCIIRRLEHVEMLSFLHYNTELWFQWFGHLLLALYVALCFCFKGFNRYLDFIWFNISLIKYS